MLGHLREGSAKSFRTKFKRGVANQRLLGLLRGGSENLGVRGEGGAPLTDINKFRVAWPFKGGVGEIASDKI